MYLITLCVPKRCVAMSAIKNKMFNPYVNLLLKLTAYDSCKRIEGLCPY